MKQERYYETCSDRAFVYDHPIPDRAVSVSDVPVSELPYYRQNFTLSKVWQTSRVPCGECHLSAGEVCDICNVKGA